MKIIDRNGRLFGRISILDVAVILLVAVLAVALYARSNLKEQTSTSVENTPITYQMLVRGVPQYVGDALKVGDQLYDPERSTGGSLGTITDIEVTDGEKLAEFNDGTAGIVPVEDGENILLTVEGSGLVKDGSYSLNRVYDMGVNTCRVFSTKYVEFLGLVTEISE